MTSCKGCGAPLDGPLSIVARLMGVKPSKVAPGYCNKCEDMALAQQKAKKVEVKKGTKKKTRKKKKKSTGWSAKRWASFIAKNKPKVKTPAQIRKISDKITKSQSRKISKILKSK